MKRNDRYSSIVDEEVIEILKKGFIKGNVYYLPSIKLERNLYEKVKKTEMTEKEVKIKLTQLN